MAVKTFHIHLFGALALFQGERPLPLPASLAARSLLAYLALSRLRLYPRSVLAGTFWPNSSEVHARRALTQALWQIRRALPGVVQSDTDSISLSAEIPVWTDAVAFQDLVRPCQLASSQEIAPKEESIQHLCQAVELYRGDLLEGFYDDWVLVERERLREMYLQAMGCLLHLEKSVGRYQDALDTALGLVRADPWQEATHREVMRLYFALHQPEAAIKQFEACRQVLHDDLGLEPEAETVALAREIATNIPQELRPYLPHIPAPALSLGDSLSQVPLVGREAERSKLIVQIEGALGGSGGTVLVEGEAGVGKTHLLQEVARDAEWRGAQVVWGHCREMEGLPPYAPWVEALQSGLSPLRVSQLAQCVEKIWLQVLGPLLPALAERLPDLLPPPPIEPAQERERLVNAFHQLLAAWGQIVPLVLVLEDLHWADSDTLDVLVSITQRLQRSNVLIVCAYRGEDARSQPKLWEKLQVLDRAGPCCRLALGRLDTNGTSDLIRRSLRLAEAAPLFESRLYQETSGNPLFVLETLRTLHEEGALFQDEQGGWHTSWDDTTADYAELPLPPAVENVIARRLERLSPAERTLLDAGAVLGSSFDFELLKETGQLDAQVTLPILGALVRRHFLIETPSAYHFNHDKIRQVIYQSLVDDDRRHLHCQAGQVLERLRPNQFSGLAHHFFRGEAREKALTYSRKAGEQAQAAFAHAEAIVHFSRALELMPETDIAARYTLLLARERAYDLQGEREAQAQDLAALQSLANALNDNQRRAEIALRQASYAEGITDHAAASAAAQIAVELAQAAGDVGQQASGYLLWGRNLYFESYEAARPLLEQALSLARSGSGTANEDKLLSQVEANSLRAIGNTYWFPGDFAEAMDYYWQSLHACRAIGDRQGECNSLNNLGSVNERLDDFNQARIHHLESLSLCRAIGHREGEGNTLLGLGNVALALNDYGEAIDYYEQALRIRQEIGDRWGLGITVANLGLVFIALGEYTRAKTHVEQAVDIFRQVKAPWAEGQALNFLSLIFHSQGDDEIALEYSQQALHLAQNHHSPNSEAKAMTTSGHALARLGRPEEAAEVYQQAIPLLQESGEYSLAMEARAGLARVFLALENLPKAQVQVAEILSYLETGNLGNANQPVRVYLTCYCVLSASQDPRAAEVLTSAYDLLQERAAKISDEQMRRSFLENVEAHRELAAAYRQMQTLQHGRQIAVRLPRADAPLNRPLRDDEWVEVTWTVQSPQDDDIPAKAARRQHCLLRLAREAETQAAAPTIDALAAALRVSRATVKRDLATLRTAGYSIKLRGERGRA